MSNTTELNAAIGEPLDTDGLRPCPICGSPARRGGPYNAYAQCTNLADDLGGCALTDDWITEKHWNRRGNKAVTNYDAWRAINRLDHNSRLHGQAHFELMRKDLEILAIALGIAIE